MNNETKWLSDDTFIPSAATHAWYAAMTENRIRCVQAGAWDANDKETFAKCRAELERRASGSNVMTVRLAWK